MVDSKFAEASCRELEVLLELVLESAATIPAAMPGVSFGYDPIIGQLFISGEDHSELRLLICKALVADAKFRLEAPGWPDLPLRRDDIAAMRDADDIRHNVVGYYGDSLRDEGWRPEHPSFNPFVSGLMACRHTPIEIRTNPELLEEFPPCRLKGMTGGWLTWRSAETLAVDRKNRRMIAAHEAAREHM